jgi:hypothetical protein
MWDRKGKYMVFVAKSEEKKPHERPRCRCWEDYIKMDIQEMK